MAIIRAIVAGERDPKKLAAFKDGRIKASSLEIASALTGNYRPELVFILQQELQLYEFYQQQIATCDFQIEQCLISFADKVDVTKKTLPKPKRRGKKQPGNAPQFDLRTHLYRISGVDFTQINGFGALTVLILLSELGLDPTRFPTVKHFTSRLTVCALAAVSLVVKSKVLKLVLLLTGPPMLDLWLHKLCAEVTLLWEHTIDGQQARLGAPKAFSRCRT
ncbi:transposase [Scytonema sp. HK-05]|nr:transposase [Scytonema sp. HK-05]